VDGLGWKSIALAAVILYLLACSGTGGRTDWHARIGQSSLEEITRDLGQPESCVGLDDGGSACSWTRSVENEGPGKLILTFDHRQRLTTVNDVRF
jgi:hypothetical protein